MKSSSRSALILLAVAAAVGPSAVRAAPPPFPPGAQDERVRTAEGAVQYILVVGEGFRPAGLQAVGGRVEWEWPAARIVVASSPSDTFVADVRAAPGLDVTSVAPAVLVLSEAQLTPGAVPGAKAQPLGKGKPKPGKEDAFLDNLQWPLQAIGAVRHPDGRTPVWQLDDVDGHAYEGRGTTVCFMDSGMPMMDLPKGKRLHEDYAWYDADTGGIVPVFEDQAALDAYYAAYGEDEGMDPSTAILDEKLGGFDTDNHATGASAIFNVRYKPGKQWAMRGIAPGAKAISYGSKDAYGWQNLEKVMWAFQRAAGDGCQVLAHATGFFFSKNVELGSYTEDYRQIFMHALQALDQANILVVVPAGNWGIDVQALHTSAGGPWWTLPQNYPPNVLVVSGAGPRDYDPDAPDLSVYDPTPGTPRGTTHNLDRPGCFDPPIGTTGYGTMSAAIDLAAPAGSQPEDPNGYFVPSGWEDSRFGYHGYTSATSQSMPTVAGVAGLAIEAYTLAHGKPPTVARLKEILTRSADDGVGPARDTIYQWTPELSQTKSFVMDFLSGYTAAWQLVEVDVDKPGRDDFLGFGRVNALQAIEEAKK
ncbi:MAG: S8 family serine peptidase [Pseudomonadota bacterium]|nr:S8 family serine peptidase [Pseudomonadota bacterium]